jgi:hypothetical protein
MMTHVWLPVLICVVVIVKVKVRIKKERERPGRGNAAGFLRTGPAGTRPG